MGWKLLSLKNKKEQNINWHDEEEEKLFQASETRSALLKQ